MLTIKDGQQVVCISKEPIKLYFCGNSVMSFGDIGVVTELPYTKKFDIRKLGTDGTTEYLDVFEESMGIKPEDAFIDWEAFKYPNNELVEEKEIKMRPVVLKLREDAKIPTKRQADSGFDLYAVWDSPVVVHKPHEVMVFPTGLKMRFPHTHVALFRERGTSGVHNMQVRAGVVEGNYSGEYKILLNNGNEYNDIIYVSEDYTWEQLRDALGKAYPYDGWEDEVEEDFFSWKDELGRVRMERFDEDNELTIGYIFPQSKAIAQMVITRKEDWEYEEVTEEEFNSIETDRGEGWNGSSNK